MTPARQQPCWFRHFTCIQHRLVPRKLPRAKGQPNTNNVHKQHALLQAPHHPFLHLNRSSPPAVTPAKTPQATIPGQRGKTKCQLVRFVKHTCSQAAGQLPQQCIARKQRDTRITTHYCAQVMQPANHGSTTHSEPGKTHRCVPDWWDARRLQSTLSTVFHGPHQPTWDYGDLPAACRMHEASVSWTSAQGNTSVEPIRLSREAKGRHCPDPQPSPADVCSRSIVSLANACM